MNDLLFADTPPVAGDKVVVQSEAGTAVGSVVPTPSMVMERRQLPEHSPNRVVRKATVEDVMVRLKRQQREQEAHRVALLKIRERGLEMKLTRVEQLFDGSRLIFYFTAEGRVDFRELVRELASEFHTRIEMRQIGARDEAKMLGGYGSCGRPLCCTTWLNTLRAGVDQDGQAAGSQLESIAAVRPVRPPEVLPPIRAAERQRREGRRLRRRRRLRQSDRLWHGGGCGSCGPDGCGSCRLSARASLNP